MERARRLMLQAARVYVTERGLVLAGQGNQHAVDVAEHDLETAAVRYAEERAALMGRLQGLRVVRGGKGGERMAGR